VWGQSPHLTPLGHPASSLQLQFYRSSEYPSKLGSGFKSLDIEYNVAECACRSGFGLRKPSWLIILIRHLGAEPEGTTVFDLLTKLIELLIPEEQRTPELCALIYATRQISEEPTDDQEELIGEEFCIDAFGPEDKVALEKEVETHKKHVSRWTEFKLDFKVWKDASSTSEYCSVFVRVVLFGFSTHMVGMGLV